MSVPQVEIGELCRVVSGGTPKRTKLEHFGGGVPWVKISDMLQGQITSTDETLSAMGLDNCSAKMLPSGTVLVSIFATIGRTAILGIDAATNQAICGVVVNDTNKLDRDYLRFCLDAKRPELEGQSRGVAQPNINTSILRKTRIPLPPIEEQRQIVDILNRAASIERLRRQASANLRDFIPALFLKMFGDPIENPMGWPTSALDDLLSNIDGGWSPRCGDGPVRPGEWGVLKLSAVTSGEYLPSEVKPLSADMEARTQLEVKSGDLLFCRKNTKQLVGACSLVGPTPSRRIFPDTVFRLVVDEEQTTNAFLWALLRQSSMRPRLEEIATGAAASMVNISKGRLREIVVPVPPVDLQRRFSELVASTAARMQLANGASHYAENLSRSLLDKLLSSRRAFDANQQVEDGEALGD